MVEPRRISFHDGNPYIIIFLSITHFVSIIAAQFFSTKFNAHLNVNHGRHDIWIFLIERIGEIGRVIHSFVRTPDLTATTKIMLNAKPSNLIIHVSLSDFA